MYHLDRRKTVRGQAVAALHAVLPAAVILAAAAGGGAGFWAGKQSRSSEVGIADTAAKQSGNTEIQAVASKVGEMEAELMRLNAVGERLVDMAGLNPQEFDFKNPPPQGGPEEAAARDYTIKEIASELGSVVGLLKDRKRKLEILEEAIKGKDLTAKSAPAGWPVRSGYITSNYGMRVHPIRRRVHFHTGVDFAAPYGAPVQAVADGVVTFSGWRGGYGKLVEIRHANGYSTRYGHNSNIDVAEGQQVRRGQTIAEVGATGTATGPHVHFEVLVNGEHTNPMAFAGGQPPDTLLAARGGPG